MSTEKTYKHLLSPGLIGKMEISNRIIMSAAMLRLAQKDGCVDHRLKDYYKERAQKSGVGLITVESTTVDRQIGSSGEEHLGIDDDKFIEGLSDLAQLIKRSGPKVAIQLHHGGHVASPVPGIQAVSASTVARPGFPIPRELTVSEIKDIIARFANGAERAKKIGFDGIEVHAAHAYLITQFLSRAWNKRQDEYGGSLKNRARLLLEIIEAIRERIGQDYPLWIKMNGAEYGVKDGITIEESQEVAFMAQEAGLDAICVSGHPFQYPVAHRFGGIGIPPNLDLRHPGYFLDSAYMIKGAVKIPVIGVGWISPELGEKALRQRKIDFIGTTRQLIADLEFPKKLFQGRNEDIRPCVHCCTCLVLNDPECMKIGDSIRQCVVNPAWQREREYEIKPTPNTKKVLIVGGGPAGMEAARVATLRGHEVVLYERGPELGGLLPFAAVFNPEVENFYKYLKNQIKKLGVKVELGQECTPALLEKIKPGVLVIAAGAAISPLGIPGSDRKNVLTLAIIQDVLANRLKGSGLLWRMGATMLRALGPAVVRRLLRFVSPFGKKVVIMGSGLAAYELADFLVEMGKKVSLVETLEDFPSGTPPMPALSEWFLDRLIFRGVPMLPGVTYEEINDKGLVITDKQQWFRTIEADTIVVVGNRQPKTELLQAFKDKIPEVYLIGDSADPCGIQEAIHSGYQTGLKL